MMVSTKFLNSGSAGMIQHYHDTALSLGVGTGHITSFIYFVLTNLKVRCYLIAGFILYRLS